MSNKSIICAAFLLLTLCQLAPLPSLAYPVSPLSVSLSSHRVAIGDPVTIRCHVNPKAPRGSLLASTAISLNCPAVREGGFCFQKCHPLEQRDPLTGEYEPLPALKDIACRSIKQASGEIIYEYSLPATTADWYDGRGFQCASANIETEWIRLERGLKIDKSRMKETTSTTTTAKPTPPPRTTPKPTTTTRASTSTTRKTAIIKAVNPTENDDGSRTEKGNEAGMQWWNFFRGASGKNSGFWNPETILLIAVAALAISLIINCCCCLRLMLHRHHRRSEGKKSARDGLFGSQSDYKPVAWIPTTDPRFLTSQQLTPSTVYRHPGLITSSNGDDPNGSDETPVWHIYGNRSHRAHPEGKAATLSNSGGRNSDSGVSLTQHPTPVPMFSPSVPQGYQFGYLPPGWSGAATPKSRRNILRHSATANPFYAGMKRNGSRETMFSERALSEIGGGYYEPKYYIPVVLSQPPPPGIEGVLPQSAPRSSHPQLAPVAPYAIGPQLWSPDASLIEEPGNGDGASAGGSSSPKAPVRIMSHPFMTLGVQQLPPSSSTERSSAPLIKGGGKCKPMTVIPMAAVQPNMNGQNDGPSDAGEPNAGVHMWLQAMPPQPVEMKPGNQQQRLPPKLADSLNTEFDVASDWSEKEPMLAREKREGSDGVTQSA